MRDHRIVASAIIAAALMLAAPALGASGGGGSGGGSEIPSASAPAYDPAAEYRKGIDALQGNNFKDALKAFKNVLAVAPKDANTNYLAGLSAIGLNDWKKAKPYLEKAAKADPNLIGAHRQLGVVKAKMGDAEGAGVERDLLKAKLAACGDTCAANAELKGAVDAVEKDAPATVRLEVTGAPGCTLHLVTDQGTLFTSAALPASGSGSAEWTTTAAYAAYVRAEVRHAPVVAGVAGA